MSAKAIRELVQSPLAKTVAMKPGEKRVRLLPGRRHAKNSGRNYWLFKWSKRA